jgi:outer membrane biosynthesis protein TonB
MKPMKILMTLLMLSAGFSVAVAQQESFDDCAKRMQGKQKIRVAPGVIQGLVQQKAVPDAADLKSLKNGDVRVKIAIDESGNVVCASGQHGDSALFERSVEAARKWKFKPYLLDGKPLIVESAFYFHFSKGKVTAKFCAKC